MTKWKEKDPDNLKQRVKEMEDTVKNSQERYKVLTDSLKGNQFENDESYAVRQQLDEFRHAVRRKGRYKVEGSEVDSVCDSGDNMDQEAASLKNDLQELFFFGF